MANMLRDLFGQDRKAMEEARLARLAGKQGIPEPVVEEPAPKKRKLNAEETSQQIVDLTGDSEAPSSKISEPPADRQAASAATASSNNKNIQFPHGVIKKTWALGFARKNDIKFEEVLQKNDLKIAVISSFQWDFDWFVTKFDPKRTKCIFIMQARNESEKTQIQEYFTGLSSVRLCIPPVKGAFACMHSKLMLLFHTEHLRVVVPTANVVPFDWGETGFMENSVWLIDLPRLPEARRDASNDTLTEFSSELFYFCDAMGLQGDVKQGLLSFDFSETRDVRFVHSIPGAYFGESAKSTGFPQLSKSVRSLGLTTPVDVPLEVDMAASSVGALDESQILTMTRALRGLEQSSPLQTNKNFKSASDLSVKDAQNFRLMFPSEETVVNSKGGAMNGSTLFLKPDYYARSTFPRDIVREYSSRRKGLLSHNKMILARSPSSAFAYVGSANLSNAAWGQLVNDREKKRPKLKVSNWECGVLVPVRKRDRSGQTHSSNVEERAEEDISTASESDGEAAPDSSVRVKKQKTRTLPFTVFEKVLEVPFEWPGKKYGKEQKPWCAR